MGKVRLVLVGAGYWGSNIARALKHVSGAELAAVVDLDAARAKTLALRYRTAWFTSLSAAVEKVRPDAVLVAVSPQNLAKVALEALEHGLHVFVEKPLALSLEDARRVAAAADARGVVGAVGFIVRFDPVIDVVEWLIDRMDVFEAHFIRIGRRPPWLRKVPIVFDLTVHDIDLAMYLFKCRLKLLSASCVLGTGDEIVYASYRCRDSIVFTATSGTSLVKVRKLFIYGDHLVVEADTTTSIVSVRSRQTLYTTRASGVEPLVRELKAFVDKIRGVYGEDGAGKLATLWDGVRVLEVVNDLVEAGNCRGKNEVHS